MKKRSNMKKKILLMLLMAAILTIAIALCKTEYVNAGSIAIETGYVEIMEGEVATVILSGSQVAGTCYVKSDDEEIAAVSISDNWIESQNQYITVYGKNVGYALIHVKYSVGDFEDDKNLFTGDFEIGVIVRSYDESENDKIVPGWSTLHPGDSGEDVVEVQQHLIDLGYMSGEPSGYYDDETYNSVKIFQAQNGLEDVDGYVGRWTICRLRDATKNFECLKVGSYGMAVRVMQKYLYSQGYLDVEPDGGFGNYSESAVKRFQFLNGLTVTGVADVETLRKIYSGDGIPFRTLSVGMEGEDVLFVQQCMVDYGFLNVVPDGIYGSYTEKAVTLFQAANGLTYVDGMCGSWTMLKLAEGNCSGLPKLVKGRTGTLVRITQEYLVRLGYLSVEPDGYYGNYSIAAVKMFQLLNELPITGEADADTLFKLYSDSAVPCRTLSVGMWGDDVLVIQNYLSDLGYLDATPDGWYGDYTKAAVIAFQAENGLEGVDGMVGNWTRGILASGSALPFAELSKGDNGTNVKVMQTYLAYYGYLNVTPDGEFGEYSESAIKKFQLMNKLPITGVCDKTTISKLYNSAAVTFRVMAEGMYGVDVMTIQEYLEALNYLEEGVKPDGSYGNYTKEAVIRFQEANGLETPDGMVGNWTLGKLLEQVSN